ncbi:MAG: energy transducer TonB [Candidatus Latescibacteria bacterium]|nr:energy transducer TonB [Candidatus Latescibacterota bacterium]
MPMAVKRKIVLLLMLSLPVLLAVSCFLYPPEIRYSSYLVPNLEEKDPLKMPDEDTGGVSYDLGGSSIIVDYMYEKELNELFPEESTHGLYSTNPYTYGNWIDPDLGYTTNRFTVFNVSVINRTFAKMRLDPTEAILITDLGETYHSYTVSIAAAKYGNSFENYYKSILGQSGNEFYRYEMRLGMVRGKNYGLDEVIFRGDSYSGLIAFDPLRPEVKRVQLVLNDIVYRFDAFNRPADVARVSFNFDRVIDKIEVTPEMRLAELEREKVRIRMAGPEHMVGNRVNDTARNARAIDSALESNISQMEKCFIDRYRRGEVDPGNMMVSFTVEPNGTVSSQNVLEVTGINSENFMNCILDVIKTLKFQEIVDMPSEGTNIVKGPAMSVNISYPITFSVYTEE